VPGTKSGAGWQNTTAFDNVTETIGRILAGVRGSTASSDSSTASSSYSASSFVASKDSLSKLNGHFMEWPFDHCLDGRVPLAGQELLAVVVLAQWIKLGRIASQSALLGPLFQCVGIMLADVFKWMVLTTWPLIAFTSCFTVLFREPYGSIASSCTKDYDTLFEDWGSTFIILMESILLGDAAFECVRKSSMPEITWVLMAAFLLTTVIMLVNLLIAMMSKSFDTIFELQDKIYLYLFARQASLWQVYPSVPPPLNLLSIPFELLSALRCCLSAPMSRTAGQSGKRAASFQRARSSVLPTGFTFPEKWIEEQSVERLKAITNRFIAEHSSDVVREDRFKHELFTHLGRHFTRVDWQLSAKVNDVRQHISTESNDLRKRLDTLTGVDGHPSAQPAVRSISDPRTRPSLAASTSATELNEGSAEVESTPSSPVSTSEVASKTVSKEDSCRRRRTRRQVDSKASGVAGEIALLTRLRIDGIGQKHTSPSSPSRSKLSSAAASEFVDL